MLKKEEGNLRVGEVENGERLGKGNRLADLNG